MLEAAKALGGEAIFADGLLDEVCGLVEKPFALTGKFEDRFLAVPKEALISSMVEHQKYFAVVDKDGNLMPNFIFISNLQSKDPSQVIEGNEKVIRPRLADAAFFFETDLKRTLDSRLEGLDRVVFQTKLGSIGDKSRRIAALAGSIAGALGADTAKAERAGRLAKADLVSEMVLEFDKLQGIAGSYYASNDGEDAAVANAIAEHYLPKGMGDKLPSDDVAIAVALADRIDTLIGIFGIGQFPTGSKDPFALRRASLGVLRILVEKNINIDLGQLIDWALDSKWEVALTAEAKADTKATLIDYMLDRFSAWYQDQNIPTVVFQAVRAKGITQPLDINKRVQAVYAFSKLEGAEALAAANKRVSNILAKNDAFIGAPQVNEALLQEDAEKALAESVEVMTEALEPAFATGNYQEALSKLADLREPVDAFFDNVMVMADDEALKKNRLTLLNNLRNLFLQVADISVLQK